MRTKVILLYQENLPALLSFADTNNCSLVMLQRNFSNHLEIFFDFDNLGSIRKVKSYAKSLNHKG